MCKCAVGKTWVEWDEVVTLGIAELQGASFQDVVCKLALGAACYNIWKHSNYIHHGNKLNSEEQILKRIDWEVRTKNTGSRKFVNTATNMDLYCRWGVSENVLTTKLGF